MGDEPRTTWHLSDEEVGELQELMLRHEDRVCEILRAIMSEAPLRAQRIQLTVPHPPGGDSAARYFAKGQIWCLMLERLRALETRH